MEKEIKIEPVETEEKEQAVETEVEIETNHKLIEPKKLQFYEKLRNKVMTFVNTTTSETGGKLAGYLFALPDFFILLCRLATDKRVTVSQKAFVGGMIAYVMLPIDIIPDFIPVIGYIDDLVLVVFALNMVLNELDPQILRDNWSGEEDVLKLMQKITFATEQFLDKNILKRIKDWINKLGK